MDQNKSDSLSDKDPAFVPCKSYENDSVESVDAPNQVHLDLVMATVGLGKGHEKENLFPYQGE